MLEEPDELGELTNDAIAGELRITQRKHGHRYSLDDVMTAWEAAASAPEARVCLELGSGIGSVLLMLAYKLGAAQFTAVEAQRNSFRLLTQNVHDNALAPRVRLIHGDLRTTEFTRSFDLVTGTPPYVPLGTATPASDSQKAYARQELRGGVEDYLAAMGRALNDEGIGVVCADARFPERAFEGARRAGLHVVRRRDVVPRAGKKGALFSVFTVSRAARPFEHAPPWVARDEAGARTPDYLAVRAFFGLTPRSEEPPSP
ncbi:MAG TPA: methyltransferase domain-containing protein [Polyangiales bacterium]